jgi:hypothetical protein
MPPSGAPACLAEKIKVRCSGGVVRASTRLPAGTLGALPRPASSAAASSAAGGPAAAAARPSAAEPAPCWSVRTGPSRARTGVPNAMKSTEPSMLRP